MTLTAGLARLGHVVTSTAAATAVAAAAAAVAAASGVSGPIAFDSNGDAIPHNRTYM